MEMTAEERQGMDGTKNHQSCLNLAPESDEKSTPLIRVVCIKEALHSQITFCKRDLKALLN